LQGLFVQLQEQRHEADYNIKDAWTLTQSLKEMLAANRAFVIWQEIRTEKISQDYLISLLIRPLECTAARRRRFALTHPRGNSGWAPSLDARASFARRQLAQMQFKWFERTALLGHKNSKRVQTGEPSKVVPKIKCLRANTQSQLLLNAPNKPAQ
jgi:hypothetical protein